ncbi:membrane fusion protein, multidrug efflux system [Desulfacinum hydrothermale DSM 13146]|uniref:Membrane fusion protein, multidrug efflux system n=1 Tax=Desulfacinum hydrothermale DSM 13146 TaxID=1121390 RepID=A0A1W1XPS1_9BACT|nr:efflux RND transporter periplasmic adaptor subunit [Desulfacinum hydrothermale]SMC25521.1 membrane fusion protein, multidrug efflux system [Desulfacinum hydrothermale DSM 13146]
MKKRMGSFLQPTGNTEGRRGGAFQPWVAFLAMGLWVLLGQALSVPAAPPAHGGGQPLPVGVVPVVERDVNPPAEYVGHVEAIQTVDLKARVEGFLQEVRFQEGAAIQEGDVLYVIEQDLYQARVAASKAQVAQARAVLERAQRYLKRLQAARPASVPATDMDTALTQVMEARANLEAAKAQLAIDRINLAYTVIRAPIGGRIGRTAFTRGNLVGPSSGTLATVVQMDPIRVVYSVSENDASAIQAALRDAASEPEGRLLTPRLRLGDGSTYPHTGRVDFVDNQVDATTATLAVRARFPNPEGRLIPGQYVTVLVKNRSSRLMPVVPQAAVLVNSQGRYVLVVDDKNQVAARPVRLGPALETQWAVESGLKPGERVIVQGIQKVRPGMTVVPRVVQGKGR